jgi:ribonuclease P protein component
MFSFKKKERLTSSRAIQKLFKEGKVYTCKPLVFYWVVSTTDSKQGVEVLFSAPKKIFNKAADRNAVKRKIREAYRLQKHKITEKNKENNTIAEIAIVYMSDKLAKYADIERAVARGLKKIQDEMDIE